MASSHTPGKRHQDFAGFFDTYFPRVYNYMRYRFGDAALADDLTARTFERAWEKLSLFDPERGSFGSWLFAIAKNISIDELRRRGRQLEVELHMVENLHSTQPQPEEAILNAEACKELLAALKRLDERQREVLALKFAARLSNREIAQQLNLSETNVGVIVYRALARLRLEMQ